MKIFNDAIESIVSRSIETDQLKLAILQNDPGDMIGNTGFSGITNEVTDPAYPVGGINISKLITYNTLAKEVTIEYGTALFSTPMTFEASGYIIYSPASSGNYLLEYVPAPISINNEPLQISTAGATIISYGDIQSSSGVSGTAALDVYNNSTLIAQDIESLVIAGTGFTLAQGATPEIAVLTLSGSGSPVAVLDETTSLTSTVSSIAFSGAGVTATSTGNDVTVTIPGGSGSPVEVLDDAGSLTTSVSSILFTGAGVTATSTGNAVTVDIPGGGGGGAYNPGLMIIKTTNETAFLPSIAANDSVSFEGYWTQLGATSNQVWEFESISTITTVATTAHFIEWLFNSASIGLILSTTFTPGANYLVKSKVTAYQLNGETLSRVWISAEVFDSTGVKVFEASKPTITIITFPITNLSNLLFRVGSALTANNCTMLASATITAHKVTDLRYFPLVG